ncbi:MULTISPECIES: PLP-dependent cysteine synthase family protein [Mycolicibacterium]|jgi:cysteine synthase|uniref:PLP-dependent cysteine synthase family protein n=1 Tax=Mycolicibacterium fortuitum TaxID=1766 RepID=A0AAE5AH12_MYCFO|nr:MULTISPECIES: PLP-dependent cysteine synthase family protein [Mycolicibacterium]OFB40485.1 pyridoxal-5'-phosphate-dependent protein subunit beta [Mycolicibacterium sp. (ex Dasyatis americana)]MCA4725243.1 PLP-dependent cysteine synthase family protein [Mycolicibacterium fortuitum]MDG5769353.1 PLP-dependent cysteine synthase family protein [Mycolicibacterium fortuitum]MDG5785001.1 PLP-dependent cysteine synthase family protein [Mycolicibacterium fortuitum]MDV7195583.1 PLP-dependent cysteine 
MNHVLSAPPLRAGHPRLLRRCDRPEAMVGETPVLRVPARAAHGSHGYWAKLEGFNPGGMKDRPAMHMVERARARGDLTPGARIIESTSGTLGLGLALAGMVYGHPVTLVTDPGMEPIVQRMLSAYGAQVDIVTQPDVSGGWQQARKRRAADILAAEPGSWHPDQYNNPDNVDGYQTLALELHAELGPIDILVCSVGTGGHSAGVARILRQFNPGLRLIGVDSIGSTIFGQPAAHRLMRGLGSSIYPRNVAYEAFSEVHWVAPAEAVWSCRALAADHFLSGGWSVGAVALVADWVARTVDENATIAAVFPDGPQRYFDTIYNDAYCRQHNLLNGRPPMQPGVVDQPTEQVVTAWTRCANVVPPQPVSG